MGDEGEMGERGFCRAENGSEWRMANSEWFFWRAVLLHCRQFSAHQEMCIPVFQPASVGFVS